MLRPMHLKFKNMCLTHSVRIWIFGLCRCNIWNKHSAFENLKNMFHFFQMCRKSLKKSTMFEHLFTVELLSSAFSEQKFSGHNRFLSKTQEQHHAAKNLKMH